MNACCIFAKVMIEMRTLEFGTWNLSLGIWILEFGTWNLELGIWILEFESWNLELGILILEFGSWNLDLGIWNLELGIWILEFGSWNLELGIWNLELGTWNLSLGILRIFGFFFSEKVQPQHKYSSKQCRNGKVYQPQHTRSSDDAKIILSGGIVNIKIKPDEIQRH